MMTSLITSVNRTLKGFVVLLALLVANGAYATKPAAGPSVPAPTIGARPANPTTATSATFTFTNSRADVSFQCALDGKSYTGCTSPKSYSDLREGEHTFRVRAQESKGKPGSAASYTWRIDRTGPPAPALASRPDNPTNQATATFSFVSGAGAASYLCRLDGAAFAPCASPKSYGGLAEGWHLFEVKAVDAVGNVGATTSYPWRVDLTSPPAPVLDSTPDDPTIATDAAFRFHDTEQGVTFVCSLDGGSFSACTSPKSYKKLSAALHTFAVRAIDAAGNSSPPASYSWSVHSPVTDLTLSGDVTQPLYPGATVPVNVVITNPFKFAVNVNQLAVTPRPATTKNGQPNPACDGTVNLTVPQQYSGPRLTVKADRTASLASLGIPPSQWPQLRMPNLATNQDACKNTAFRLHYSATATKVNQ